MQSRAAWLQPGQRVLFGRQARYTADEVTGNGQADERPHLDPGDRWCGRYDPPRPCRVLVRYTLAGGPRNVLVRYAEDGCQAVIPFPRRLRRAGQGGGDVQPC
jgi:hypothetical protein